ncbi:MAG: hypothetical protein WDN03_17105 [Rhizomicrobium sp.]
MSFSLGTITALLLLLPGVGFIVGVNFTDKNVREIVFRNTPAEIGYVIAVSLVVHLLFAWLFSRFNVASVILDFQHLETQASNAPAVTVEQMRQALVGTLFYFVMSSFAGAIPGIALGFFVRLCRLKFFAKHPWMLELIRMQRTHIIYVRVLLSPYFPTARDAGNSAIAIEGVLSDCFFDSDGTLLYLVLKQHREQCISLSDAAKAGGDMDGLGPSNGQDKDYLIIEGRWIVKARYTGVDRAAVVSEPGLAKLREMVADEELPSPS